MTHRFITLKRKATKKLSHKSQIMMFITLLNTRSDLQQCSNHAGQNKKNGGSAE